MFSSVTYVLLSIFNIWVTVMEIHSEQKNDGYYLTLPAKLALPQSVQLKELLSQASSDNQDVTIDFKNVQDIKTPFIQTLVAGLLHFSKHQKQMKCHNLVSSVEGAFIDLGLSAELNQVKEM